MSKYKSGIDYFPFDIDFFHDEKIEFVAAKYGITGELITIKLLCKIYRSGYYLKWGDDECLLFSKKVGENISAELVKNVIDELLKRNFFNQIIYKKYSILTSTGIQKRFLEAAKRRKEVYFYKEYYLLNNHNVDNKQQNVYIIALNVDIPNLETDFDQQNVDIQEQSRVEKRRVKESKVKKTVSPAINFNYSEAKFIGLDDDCITKLKKDYPGCDVGKEITKMIRWLIDNKKKNRKGKLSFIHNWLERENNKGGNNGFHSQNNRQTTGHDKYKHLEEVVEN